MLAACPAMFSQSNWHWQNPLPQGNGLFRVKFLNSTDAIAVGSSGTIMKTADAGLTWDITHYVTGSSKILKSLYFLDESNGWVGGYDGKLLHTTNGGVSWDSVTGHSNHIIQGIAFPNPQKGAIATAFQNNICCASIFQTTNGGTSWNQRALPPDAQDNLYDLAFSNEQIGMAVGLFGLILRTTDGGVNWFQQSGATEEHLFSIDHVGDSLWFAAGNGRIIVKSTDAGATWSESFHGVTGDFEGIDMVDENTGYVCGDNGEIRKTTDGGISWSLQQSGTTNLLYGISFADENTGIAVGYFGTIVRTSNGGETWQVISEGTVQDLLSVDFPENQTSGISQTLYGISFPSVNVGTAVGDNGKLIKTTNGGQNWFQQSSGITGSGRLNSVSFVNENTGFAAGFNASSAGTIIKTTNGGSSWTNVPTGITSLLFAIDFLNENYGIAVGGDGALIITTNSGSTWVNKSLGFGNTLTSIKVVSDNFAVAAGFNFNVFPSVPVVIVSTDGGETWVDRSNGITQLITKVFFADSSQGTAIGISGEIYRTTDGGLNWSFELSGTDNALNSVYMIDPDNIIITGRGGTILSSNPVVPVELSSFTGRAEGNHVVLQWKTSTETNNSGFEIQRRIKSDEKGDNNFEKAGYLNGHGTSTETHNYSFADHNLEPGIYEYRLKQIDLDGSFEYSDLVEIKISQTPGYSLEQNYPNPFNPSTMIKYSVSEAAKVELKVFDVLGREVRTLVNETKAAGKYQVRFDGNNLSSGIYLVRIKAGEFIQTKAMTLLK
jgi:photosystem II stability/assembly factor-like uncharacterized protein